MSTLVSVRSTLRHGQRISSAWLRPDKDAILDLDDPAVMADLQKMRGLWYIRRLPQTLEVVSAAAYNPVGDGVTDDTAALTSWINAVNSAANGVCAFLPPKQYAISSPLPAITAQASIVMGSGWAQTNYLNGSTITALAGLSGTMLTVAGEGTELSRLTVDGAGRAATPIAVTASNVKLFDLGVHGAAAGGVCVDGQTGSVSLWVEMCRLNAINAATALQLNDTDAIVGMCKPTNCQYGIVLLSGASGAIIHDNHITNGASVGVNSIYINGNPSHIQISGNRFDNYVQSAIQIIGQSSPSNSIKINDNHFHSTVITDNTYAIIALDTTAGGVRALQIVGNDAYGSGSNRPKWFLSAQTQAGGTPTNTGRLASLGTLCSGNVAWAATAFQGNGAPTVARGNMTATDGQTYTAVTDI